ncbi:hypothetical protein QTP88_027441 [Uroleucon formosanum]
MFTKPPALKSPSIRQPPYSKDVQKQKNKTSPTTPKNLPKPNSLKITSNPKPLHQMLPKNSPNVNTSTSSINTDINKQSFASTVEPIHNTALRLSIGAFKSSPVLSIISITGTKSLEKRRIKHTLEYSSKTLIATKNPISTILRNSINQFQNNDINNLGTPEYLALLKATELAASSDIQSSTIYTDSLSALTNLANPQKNNPIGNLILNIIFLSKKDIRFLWVPGHNNIPGNEIADEIAKKATKEPTDFWNITTHLDTKLLINTNLDQTCLQEWRSLRNNKLREIKSSTLPWLPDTSLPRRHQIVLNRLRIGHTLYTHEHLLSKKEQPICTSCNTVTTVKHLLTECLLTKDARDKLMLPNNLCEILAPNTERTSSLLELLKETNLQKI